MIDRPRSQHYNTSKVVITPSSQLTNAKQLTYNKTFPNSLQVISPHQYQHCNGVITDEKTDKFSKMFKL